MSARYCRPVEEGADLLERHIFVVQTSAVPGREDEFNRWYDDEHLAQVLEVPGFVAAQRFARSAIRLSPDTPEYPYQSLALYEFTCTPEQLLRNLDEEHR